MVRVSISSALLVALTLAFGACAKNQPADTAAASAPSQGTAGQPQGQGMMAGQGMMGPGMMDGGAGMMGGQGMMGPGMMDAGPGMMGGSGMMGDGQGMMSMMMVMMGMGDHCPMLVPGTTVQAKDTSNGMAMTFATTGNVAELRRRVRVMAEHMNTAPSGSSGGMGMHGTMMAGDGGMGMMGGGMTGGMMPAVRAEVEDVDKGARLNMTPVDASKLNDMRAHMKQHVQTMNQSHGCPMAADAGK